MVFATVNISDPQSAPVDYVHNKNHMLGGLGHIRGKDGGIAFPSYSLKFTDKYKEFFDIEKDKKSWAREYSAAQRLFAQTADGVALRTAAFSVGTYMFLNKPRISIRGFRGDQQKVEKGQEFMKMISNGRWGDGPVLYDFVLTIKGKFRFAPVFAFSMFTEMASKHATLNRAGEEVLYAGDMVVGEDQVLYISNNSGTYQPSFENIQKLVKLLEAELPELKVVPVDFAGPDYKKYFEAAENNSKVNNNTNTI